MTLRSVVATLAVLVFLPGCLPESGSATSVKKRSSQKVTLDTVSCATKNQAFDPVKKGCVSCESLGKFFDAQSSSCVSKKPTADDCAKVSKVLDPVSTTCVACVEPKVFSPTSKTCVAMPSSPIVNENLPDTFTLGTPMVRMVFQRNANNRGKVLVEGMTSGGATEVQARVIVRANMGGTTSAWQKASVEANGAFRFKIEALGGWYDLELAAFKNANQVGFKRLERVGVGEVFITAGQSNQFGSNRDDYFAEDDRVSLLNYLSFAQGPGYFTPEKLPKEFSQAGKDTNAGPLGTRFIWGKLGDTLVSRLKVPVLFLAAAHPGSAVYWWKETAEGKINVLPENDRSKYDPGAPYFLFKYLIDHYLKRTGVRAVLWHQGESDNYSSTADYANNLQVVIQKSRADSGFGNLGWVIARASYMPRFHGGQDINQAVLDAQNQLIGGRVSNAFPGPETDKYTLPDIHRNNNEFDHVHFSPAFFPTLMGLWNDSLSNDFFSKCEPSVP